jgi:hypothetical protein
MKAIRWFIVGHLILGPLGVAIIADDMRHPERWDILIHDPSFAIPCCIVLDAILIGTCIHIWWDERKQQRLAKGIRLLREAIRLDQEGNRAASDEAYFEGCRLSGIVPKLKRQGD